MKREELYHKTVDILVNAYFNDTLKHNDCHTCAVGNIVAANIGAEIVEGRWVGEMCNIPNWYGVHCFDTLSQKQRITEENYKGIAKQQIDATGYSWQETAAIELAFETAPEGNSEDEWMFNGLMAVIDCLDKIHENTDELVSEKSKKRFVKAH